MLFFLFFLQSLGFDLMPPSPKKPLPILASGGDHAEKEHPLPVNLSLRTDEGMLSPIKPIDMNHILSHHMYYIFSFNTRGCAQHLKKHPPCFTPSAAPPLTAGTTHIQAKGSSAGQTIRQVWRKCLSSFHASDHRRFKHVPKR